MADKVVRLQKSVTLEPMNPYERRVIHSALQEVEGVETGSIGHEPQPSGGHLSRRLGRAAQQRVGLGRPQPAAPPQTPGPQSPPKYRGRFRGRRPFGGRSRRFRRLLRARAAVIFHPLFVKLRREWARSIPSLFVPVARPRADLTAPWRATRKTPQAQPRHGIGRGRRPLFESSKGGFFMSLSPRPIAAISTALQDAAIGVVRLSGPGSHEVALRCFRPLSGKVPRPRRACVGRVFDAQGDIDLAVLTLWAAPASFTGEDMAEFSCHGGRVVLYDVLAALLEAGARQAGPGEFTRRAFLNGKLDLAESEAIIDLITAGSRAAARAALSQASGALSQRCRALRAGLVEADADILAYVDFSDEGVVQADPAVLCAALREAEAGLDALLATCRRGRVVKEGAPTAIIGKPNAGKSSLLNLLAGSERAIVTELPGTTRDVVSETVSVGGLALRLLDTAGLRDTADPVERIGVQRSRQAAAEASLLLAVFDASRPWDELDDRVLSLCEGREAIAISEQDRPAAAYGAVRPAKTLPLSRPAVRRHRGGPARARTPPV